MQLVQNLFMLNAQVVNCLPIKVIIISINLFRLKKIITWIKPLILINNMSIIINRTNFYNSLISTNIIDNINKSMFHSASMFIYVTKSFDVKNYVVYRYM